MNDDVSGNQKDGDSSLKDSESFKKQYAAVLVQLNEANEQVWVSVQEIETCNFLFGFFLKKKILISNTGVQIFLGAGFFRFILLETTEHISRKHSACMV